MSDDFVLLSQPVPFADYATSCSGAGHDPAIISNATLLSAIYKLEGECAWIGGEEGVPLDGRSAVLCPDQLQVLYGDRYILENVPDRVRLMRPLCKKKNCCSIV